MLVVEFHEASEQVRREQDSGSAIVGSHGDGSRDAITPVFPLPWGGPAGG